jgi:diacylglycerol O-acyltransferase / wax synthase
MGHSERLTALDAAFLYFERPEQPLHVGCLAMLEGPVPLERFAATIDRRLARLPRYHERPVRPLLDLALPRWQADATYDVHHHVRRVGVPAPGGEAELRELVDRLFATRCDGAHPLWEMTLIEGLQDGRAALLCKVHHAMIDGVSGAQVLAAITDAASAGPDAVGAPGRAPRVPPMAGTLERARTLAGALAATITPAGLAARAADAWQAAVTVASFVRAPAASAPFNGPIRDGRHVAWADFALDDFLALRGAAGCKVNDVVLAVIAGGIRRHLLRRGVAVDGMALRALVPVSTRRDDEHLQLGNRVSAMFATLPVGEADPLARLRTVMAETRILKAARQSSGTELALAVLGALPAALGPLASRVLPERALVNTVCTNVPGPREPRWLCGRRVVAVHPIVPIMLNIGLGFAIMSYAGRLSICATADAHLVPDAAELPAALQAALDELTAALAVPTAVPAARPLAAPAVADVMTRGLLHTVAPTDSLAHAWTTMSVQRIRHLPVVDDARRLVGLVTHRDLLAASTSSLALPLEAERVTLLGWHRVSDVMETHVSTAAPDEPAAEAGRRLVRHKIGCLPVVGADGRLTGIVTQEDYARWAAEHMAQAS